MSIRLGSLLRELFKGVNPQSARHRSDDLPRAIVELLPNAIFKRIYNTRVDEAIVERDDDLWVVRGEWGQTYIPRMKDAIRLTHLHETPRQKVFQKYQLPGFVEIEDSDTVVETGAFFGEFATFTAEQASQLIAIDPDPRNAACLRKNLVAFENARVIERVLWHEDTTIEFTVGHVPSESSLFGVDQGGTHQQIEIEAITLSTLASELKLGHGDINFLKIEAEGAEPEVLAGFGDIYPRKIAIDCSPERGEISPAVACQALLEERGYEVRQDENILFARL